MEEAQPCGLTYHAQEAYPPIQAQGRNQRYAAAMLSNLGGANSEMTAVSQYFYDHLVTAGSPEVSEAFRDISVVEMHHLEIFGALALQLGADPRLWSVQQGRRSWWSPDYVHYARKLGPLLHGALQAEHAAIRKYQNQTRWIRDENVLENLRRVILDEEQHVQILTCLCERCGVR